MVKKGEWSQEEKKFLKDNYLTMPYKDIAAALNRSKGAVGDMCMKMNLNKVEKLRKLRVEYIKKYYRIKRAEDIAKHLNITVKHVRNIASELGVAKRRDIFNEHMIYALYKGEELMADGNVYEIADSLGIDVKSVKFYHAPSVKKRNVGGNGKELVFLYDEEEEE